MGVPGDPASMDCVVRYQDDRLGLHRKGSAGLSRSALGSRPWDLNGAAALFASVPHEGRGQAGGALRAPAVEVRLLGRRGPFRALTRRIRGRAALGVYGGRDAIEAHAIGVRRGLEDWVSSRRRGRGETTVSGWYFRNPPLRPRSARHARSARHEPDHADDRAFQARGCLMYRSGGQTGCRL